MSRRTRVGDRAAVASRPRRLLALLIDLVTFAIFIGLWLVVISRGEALW